MRFCFDARFMLFYSHQAFCTNINCNSVRRTAYFPWWLLVFAAYRNKTATTTFYHTISYERTTNRKTRKSSSGFVSQREIAETRNQGRVTGTLTVGQCRRFSVGILFESFRIADTFRLQRSHFRSTWNVQINSSTAACNCITTITIRIQAWDPFTPLHSRWGSFWRIGGLV